MKDHPKLAEMVDDWRAGRGPLTDGSTSYGAASPERDHYTLRLRRDGSVCAHFTDMDLERRFLVTYGKHDPQCRWAYEVPACVSEVFQ